MTKTSLCTILLVLVVMAARPASAEEPGTFIRVTARPNLSGHTEVVIHKAYAGQSGPIHDIITLQSPGADGYPKVKMTTSGAIKATREYGGIVIESTGPGLGEIDLFITYNHLQSTTWLQMMESPGVGAIRLNAVVEFGDGLHPARRGNNLTVRSPDGQEKALIDQSSLRFWSANATVATGSMVLLNVAGEPDPVAPLWMAQVSLGIALLALALSGYLTLKLMRKGSSQYPSP